MHWYYRVNGEVSGPVTADALAALAVEGYIKPTDLVRPENKDKWYHASSVKGLIPAAVQASNADSSNDHKSDTTSRHLHTGEPSSAPQHELRLPPMVVAAVTSRGPITPELVSGLSTFNAYRRRRRPSLFMPLLLVGCGAGVIAIGLLVGYLLSQSQTSQPAATGQTTIDGSLAPSSVVAADPRPPTPATSGAHSFSGRAEDMGALPRTEYPDAFFSEDLTALLSLNVRAFNDSPLMRTHFVPDSINDRVLADTFRPYGVDPRHDILKMYMLVFDKGYFVIHVGRFNARAINAGTSNTSRSFDTYGGRVLWREDSTKNNFVFSVIDDRCAISGDRGMVMAAIDRLSKGQGTLRRELRQNLDATDHEKAVWFIADTSESATSPITSATSIANLITSIRAEVDMDDDVHIFVRCKCRSDDATQAVFGSALALKQQLQNPEWAQQMFQTWVIGGTVPMANRVASVIAFGQSLQVTIQGQTVAAAATFHPPTPAVPSPVSVRPADTWSSAPATPTLPPTPVAVPPQRVEELLVALLQSGFNENKQKMFDSIHPVGTAMSVKVHAVTITTWKGGVDTNRFEDIGEFDVRFTLYWQGPITTDGFTKINWTYDAETQRYIRSEILATNGITNEQAGEEIGVVCGALLREALRNKQN